MLTLFQKVTQMQNFNLGSLASWRSVAIGEIIDLDVPTAGFRSVAFDIMANGFVSVNAVSGEDYWLVGCGQGELSCKFAIDRAVGLVVVGDAGTDVFIRTLVDAPIIPESLEASYTTIEPRPAGPSDDLRRIMHMVRINQERREKMLLAEVERLSKGTVQPGDAVIEAEPAPAAPPAAPEAV